MAVCHASVRLSPPVVSAGFPCPGQTPAGGFAHRWSVTYLVVTETLPKRDGLLPHPANGACPLPGIAHAVLAWSVFCVFDGVLDARQGLAQAVVDLVSFGVLGVQFDGEAGGALLLADGDVELAVVVVGAG